MKLAKDLIELADDYEHISAGWCESHTKRRDRLVRSARRAAEALPAARDSLDTMIQLVEQLLPDPSKRGVADLVLFQASAALASLEAP